MSAIASPAAAGTRPTRAPRDTRRLRRITAAVLMPLGPATIAVLRGFSQDATTLGEQIAADPAAHVGWAVLGWVALFTLVPGIYAALQLTRRRAPVLTAWTGALLIPAYLGMTALDGLNAAAWAGVQAGLSPQEASQLAELAMGAPGVLLPAIVFVVGHIIGTVMLGILAIRTGHMPVWFGSLFAVSQIVHFIATMSMLAWLDFLAWGVTAVGMGVLAWHVLRLADDDWDLPPVSRR